MKNIVILGAGESGIGAAILAQKKGDTLFVSDIGPIEAERKKTLDDLKIPYEEGGHSMEKILEADEVIKSPGIPDDVELVKEIRKNGIPIISEVEFASRHTDAKIIAITGSNGKTTTTALTYALLNAGGLNVGMAGNIGDSFARMVAMGDHEYYVLEVSSFQLDGIIDFHPHIAVLLNITPDHLDRYEDDFEKYVDSKFRITNNQVASDYFIYCTDDKAITTHIKETNIDSTMIPFSIHEKVDQGAYVEGEKLIIDLKKKPFDMFIYELALQGKHNLYNSMAAGVVANLFDLRKDVIRESFTSFKSLEHRLEFVAKIHGIDFINDSKATNVNSTWYALETMSKPLIWIAGGVDKGNDYGTLQPLVKDKVKAIVCLGKNITPIHEAFQKDVDLIVNTSSAEEAVKMAYHLAKKGDAVLLSPACASFDIFKNYEDRGRQFKKAVRDL